MLRRLFRIGLTLGILGGLAAALARALGLRQPPDPGPATAVGPLPRESWPPLEPDPTALEPTHDASLQVDPEAPPAAAPEPMPTPTDAGAEALGEGALAWVEPDGDVCPTTHPIKAKLGSKIFHVPGGLSYARVKPDRCYRDAPSAEGDGLRPAKR